MTIERLEEMKLIAEGLYQDSRASLVFCDDITELISKEIERQSVTDEEIQDAIAWLKSMSELGYKPTADKAKIALQALQLFGKSEHVGNGEKSGCKRKQAVCLNGTAYCANCGRRL